MKRRLTRFLIKLLLFVLPVALGFELLFRMGLYPVMTTSQLFDYKMLQVQRHPVRSVKLLAIGSSVGLFDLNSAVIAKNIPLPYYNFSSWGLQMSDIRLILTMLADQYRPSDVMILSAVRDFVGPGNGSYANYTRMPAFIRNHFPEYFYAENYTSLHSIFLRKYRARRPVFDPWGGASVTELRKDIVADDRNERLVFPTGYTAAHYRALDSLSAFLEQRGIRLIFAQAPMKASYTATADARQALAIHFQHCRSIVEAHHGVYLNYYDTTVFRDGLFADLTHLQEAGTVVLTNKMVSDLKGLIE